MGEQSGEGEAKDASAGESLGDGQSMPLPCPDCPRSFGSQRGLSQHRRSAHGENYFKQLATVGKQKKKGRWTPGEVTAMSLAEAQYLTSCQAQPSERELAAYLSGLFPSRSTEAIRGRRKTTEWSESVREHLRTINGEANPACDTTEGIDDSETEDRQHEALRVLVLQLGQKLSRLTIDFSNEEVVNRAEIFDEAFATWHALLGSGNRPLENPSMRRSGTECKHKSSQRERRAGRTPEGY